jgi:hypothetical protein
MGYMIGYYDPLPPNPEMQFYVDLQEHGVEWQVNEPNYSTGLNYLMYKHTMTLDVSYTKMFYGIQENFNEMINRQVDLIDCLEPSVTLWETKDEYGNFVYHCVVLIGYDWDPETQQFFHVYVNDPTYSKGGDKYTMETWQRYTAITLQSGGYGWFFTGKEYFDKDIGNIIKYGSKK